MEFRKWLSLLLTLAMALGMLPGTALAEGLPTRSYNENGLVNFIEPSDGNYVWMGAINSSPVKWKIIGEAQYEYLLISAELMGSMMNWSNAWDFCRYNMIYDYFTETEQSAIPWTNKMDPDDYCHDVLIGRAADVSDKLFLLSVPEVETYLPSNAERMPGDWWTRSHQYRDEEYSTHVNADGTINTCEYNSSSDPDDWHRGRPAFQLDRSIVLCESAAEGGKSKTLQGGGSFGALSGPSGSGNNEVKLTLIDYDRSSGRFGFSADIAGDNEAVVAPGGTVTINYSGAASGDRISALLCQGNTAYYATTQQSSSGKWTVTLPDNLHNNYTLKVFSEQQNGNKKTDYASPVTEIALYAPYTVTYKVENGVWSDESTGNKTEYVAYGQKPANVPTGMIAWEGYTGGAWTPDPTKTAITRPTTFTYTFERIKYAVTVTGGTANKTSAAQGESVTVTAAAPEAGMRFKEWSGAEGLSFTGGSSAASPTATFTMPAHGVALEAAYEAVYAVTVTGGTANKTSAAQGESVTVTAAEPEAGMRFREWSGAEGLGFTGGSSAADAAATFTMPAHGVALAAAFEAIPRVAVAVEFGEGHGDFAEARFGSMEGFTVNGTTLTYTVLSGTTMGDAKEVFGSKAELIRSAIDDGALFTDSLALYPASRYASLAEVNAERAVWDGQPVPEEGITFHVQWEQPVGAVTVSITAPEPGTVVTVSGSEPTRRTDPQAVVSVTGNAFLDTDSGADWRTDYEGTYYSGTVAAGQACYARFYLRPNYGYYFACFGEQGPVFADGVSVTVENDSEAVIAIMSGYVRICGKVIAGQHTVTVANGTADKAYAAEGESVTVTAAEPEAGMRFKGWSGAEGLSFTDGSSAASPTATFTMPAADVTLAATYEAVMPSFTARQLILSGQIGMHFYMTIPEGMRDGSMTFTVGSRTAAAGGALQSDGRYRFTCYVNSVEMAETITATYTYTAGGETRTVTDTTSVKAYLEAIITNNNGLEAYTAATPLAKAIYNYGHYAMQALPGGNKHPEMPDTYAGEADLIASLEGYAIEASLDDRVITAATYSLDLDSETTINFYLTAEHELTEANVSVTANATFAYTVEKVDSRYLVRITGIGAHELGEVFMLRTENTTISASVMTYVQQCLAGENTSAEAKQAAAALYAYYRQAINYIG